MSQFRQTGPVLLLIHLMDQLSQLPNHGIELAV